jgi:septation ring formation regulator EzrA
MMMEAGKSESIMASNMRSDLGDTVYGAKHESTSGRFKMSDSQEWSQNRQLSPTEQRLAAMVQALLELEERNNELATAIKQKDIAIMDKHIEYHRQYGSFTDSMARQTVFEVNKQLNSGGHSMEWQIS